MRNQRIGRRENEKRDRLLAGQFRDAYQKGWTAKQTGCYFAEDIQPLIASGRIVDLEAVLKEAKRLRVRTDPEFGSWPQWFQKAASSFVFSLWNMSR